MNSPSPCRVQIPDYRLYGYVLIIHLSRFELGLRIFFAIRHRHATARLDRQCSSGVTCENFG